MNLQAIGVFCDVAREQSFSRGADVAGISQSAASQLVAHLEGELGFKLLDRSRRPLRLTREGELYFEGAQELLSGHRMLLDEIRQLGEALAGTVRVASIYSAGLHTLSAYIQGFMTDFDGATVRLSYFLPARVVTAVIDDEADIGVVSYPRPHRELHIIPWVDEEMVLACPADHPLASRGRMPLKALDGEAFVAFDRGLRIRREIDKTLRANQVGVRVVSEFDNIETVKQALEVSQAVTLLPRASIERELQRGTLAQVDLEDCGLRRPLGIIHKRKKRLNRTTERFIEALVEGAKGQTV